MTGQKWAGRLRRLFQIAFGLTLVAGSGYLIWSFAGPSPSGQMREIGAYASEESRIVVFSQTSETCLRYVFFTGEAGHVCRQADGSYAGATYLDGQGPETVDVSFAEDTARLMTENDGEFSARAIDVDRIDTEFVSDDARLMGQLLAPPGDGPVKLAVMVQGSSRKSALLHNNEQHFLSAKGIATFV